ncbi:hypothetical protein [Tolypothrix sp. PCC 7910]|nr:hypothetical protein [Tolypothrix sp. PCC 7910]
MIRDWGLGTGNWGLGTGEDEGTERNYHYQLPITHYPLPSI